MTVSIAAAAELAPPKFIVTIDLDERAFLFPDGKHVAQLRVLAMRTGRIVVEMVYTFNETRVAPTLLALDREDAAEFVRKLTDAVYRAQGTMIFSESMRINVAVVANGYILQVGEAGAEKEFFLGPGAIWRVLGGLMRAIDQIGPVVAH